MLKLLLRSSLHSVLNVNGWQFFVLIEQVLLSTGCSRPLAVNVWVLQIANVKRLAKLMLNQD